MTLLKRLRHPIKRSKALDKIAPVYQDLGLGKLWYLGNWKLDWLYYFNQSEHKPGHQERQDALEHVVDNLIEDITYYNNREIAMKFVMIYVPILYLHSEAWTKSNLLVNDWYKHDLINKQSREAWIRYYKEGIRMYFEEMGGPDPDPLGELNLGNQYEMNAAFDLGLDNSDDFQYQHLEF